MFKFKKGDKIVRKEEWRIPVSSNGYDGRVLTVIQSSMDGLSEEVIYEFELEGTLVKSSGYSENFDLYEEEKHFCLKTQPWKILVKNEEESRMAQDWLFSQGCSWYGGSTTHLSVPSLKMLTNCEDGRTIPQVGFMWSHDTERQHLAPEIKLTFGVIGVEYPVIPQETEAQRKLKELEEQQRKIADEIAKLREIS